MKRKGLDVLVFPPHARGWTFYDATAPDALGVSPARAGMDPGAVRRAESGPSFPRTRGDGPYKIRFEGKIIKFPPHARGWTASYDVIARPPRVSPARAGMDPGVTSG